MRAFLLSALGLVVSACSPSVGVGDACSLDDPCDEGVCNLSGPGDPVCVDANGDLDGDGLPNKSDFCNQQPGGNFDEDGDGRGDECDACPIAPPPAQPDRDTDMVDSPCDPDPTMDGNRITMFEGFNGTLPASWRKDGPWEVRGGEAKLTSADPNLNAILTAPLPLASRHLAVQASYRADRVLAGANQNLAGVVSIDRRPAGTTAVTCGGSRVGGMDSLVVTADSAGSMSKAFTNVFDPAGLYRIAQLIDNASGACAMDANTQDGAVSASTLGETPTEAGLIGRAADVRFQYLLIVQRPN